MSKLRFYPERERTGYEELMSYYPRYYRGVDEMEAILKYFGGVCDDFEAQTEQAYLNNFIATADADVTKSWEDAFGITYSSTLSLEQRRRVVLGRASGGQHIGEPEIRVLVAVYTDCDIKVDFWAGLITIDIDGEIFDEGNLYETLLSRIPAHLRLKMTARTIRTYRLDLPVSFGAAIGAEQKIEPQPQERKSEIPLSLLSGGYAYTKTRTQPYIMDRLMNAELDFSHGGAYGTEQAHTPKGHDRHLQDSLDLAVGGFSLTKAPTQPVAQDRAARAEIDFATGGAFGAERRAEPLAPEHTDEAQTRSAGGFYCRTHIKSKLIKEEI